MSDNCPGTELTVRGRIEVPPNTGSGWPLRGCPGTHGSNVDSVVFFDKKGQALAMWGECSVSVGSSHHGSQRKRPAANLTNVVFRPGPSANTGSGRSQIGP